MNEYPKIQGVFKRDLKTKKFTDEWSLPEFDYLKWNDWIWTEKVDGMNIRVIYKPYDQEDERSYKDSGIVYFAGKTDKAQLPNDLLTYLGLTFTVKNLSEQFPEGVCLYGEGYGAGIQKGGHYSPTKKFVLFDIKIGHWWLRREDVINLAKQLEIDMVPCVGKFPLVEAVYEIKKRIHKSHWGNFLMEGIVGTPVVPLHCRDGNRVITKLKHKDWEE